MHVKICPVNSIQQFQHMTSTLGCTHLKHRGVNSLLPAELPVTILQTNTVGLSSIQPSSYLSFWLQHQPLKLKRDEVLSNLLSTKCAVTHVQSINPVSFFIISCRQNFNYACEVGGWHPTTCKATLYHLTGQHSRFIQYPTIFASSHLIPMPAPEAEERQMSIWFTTHKACSHSCPKYWSSRFLCYFLLSEFLTMHI